MTSTETPTPGTRQRYRETPEYAAMVKRMMRAHGKRVAQGNLEDLAELVKLREDLEDTILVAAHGLHQDHSWTEIGRVLGLSRQGARQAAARAAARAQGRAS
jgi:hypothetical protein